MKTKFVVISLVSLLVCSCHRKPAQKEESLAKPDLSSYLPAGAKSSLPNQSHLIITGRIPHVTMEGWDMIVIGPGFYDTGKTLEITNLIKGTTVFKWR